MNTVFSIGDKVEWTSQAGGHRTTKRGVVIYVVAPNTTFLTGLNGFTEDFLHTTNRLMDTGAIKPCTLSGAKLGQGGRRRERSYAVLVGKKLYWPWPSQLRRPA